MAATNEAAWLDGQGQPLRVGPAEMPKPGAGEVVIRNRAIALNPISCKIQDTGIVVQQWPVVLDMDVAGEVHEVGPGVHDFVKGDRIVAWLEGQMSPDSKYGAFQRYSAAKAATVAKLPAGIAFAEASVLPTCFNTAIVALCAPTGQGFGLPLPSLDAASIASGKTIVVWGASSSVGLQTLQVARAAGIETIAVASAHNAELCLSCGAAQALDYHNPSIVEDVIRAAKAASGEFVGVLDCASIPDKSLNFCIEILQKLGGGTLAYLQPHIQVEVPSDSNITVTKVLGVGDITHAFWKDYITPALEAGTLKCLPEVLVVDEGLHSLQKAINVLRKGVSAKKVVVTL